MTTLADATLALARVLGNVRGSTTTSAGDAGGTTVVDSTRTEAADYWNGGTLWITSGAQSGKSRKITDWALSGTTFTTPAWAAQIATSVAYSVLNGDWPQDKLIEFLNAALGEYGYVTSTDATLVTVADQERYALPTGVSRVKRVEIATGSSTPYYYVPHLCWREPGDGYLYFDTGREPGDAGYAIRLHYESRHAALTADTDVVSAYANLERLTWEAAVKAWEWRMAMTGRDRPEYAQRMAYAAAKAAELRARYPTKGMARDPRLSL